MFAADKRRKDPRSIPRPWDTNKGTRRAASRDPEPGFHTTESGGVKAVGLAGMLTATQRRGAVTLG